MPSLGRTRTARACAIVVLASLFVPVQAEASSDASGLELVGRSDLGGRGMNGDVAVLGSTAFVSAGSLPAVAVVSGTRNPARCAGAVETDPSVTPPATVKVVDLSDPADPQLVSEIPVPPSHAAVDVDVLRVGGDDPYDLLAVALVNCGLLGLPIERGVAYYDVSDAAAPLYLGRYRADLGDTANLIPVASSQYSVTLTEQDGRVLSLSTEPYASASGYASGDLRIVDVTDPRNPAEVGSFHPATEGQFFSANGCRPYLGGIQAAVQDGRALLASYDAGVFDLDLTDPASPVEQGRFAYPGDVTVEGNASHISIGEVDGAPIGVLVEDDFIAPDTQIVADDGTSTQTYRGCEAAFTLADPDGEAPIFAHPGGEITAEVVYVGGACPGQGGIDAAAEPLLADPTGRIALADRGGCSFTDKTARLERAGAVAALIRNNSTFPIFSADGAPEATGIPMVMIGQLEGGFLRDDVANGPVTVTLRDVPGGWGGVRVLDLSDPALSEVSTFTAGPAAVFPPADAGIYSAARSAVDGSQAWVAWNSAGVRVLDLSDPSAPTELASFVPPDSVDPSGNMPPKALVRGVALLEHEGDSLGVISDYNGGLFVLRSTA